MDLDLAALDREYSPSSRVGGSSAPFVVAYEERSARAARELGATGDEVRLALALAAMREGRRIAQLDEAVAVAAAAGRLDPKVLRERAGSAAVRDRVTASTAEFHTHRISQRPAFVLEDPIGDKAVFSGLVAAAPLAATIDAMLADTRAYASYAAHHGKPPG